MTRFEKETTEILKGLVKGITAGYKEGLNFETYPEENYKFALSSLKKILSEEIDDTETRERLGIK